MTISNLISAASSRVFGIWLFGVQWTFGSHISGWLVSSSGGHLVGWLNFSRWRLGCKSLAMQPALPLDQLISDVRQRVPRAFPHFKLTHSHTEPATDRDDCGSGGYVGAGVVDSCGGGGVDGGRDGDHGGGGGGMVQ